MGIGPDSRGLQAGIRGHSSFFRYQRNKSTFSSGASYRRRNKQSFKQKSNRNCQSVEVSERFLQHIVFSAQKEWGNATSNKFKASKRVSEENSFQDGYNVESTKSSAKRRLWNKSRSEGRVLPFKNFQETSKVPTFLFSKENLSVPSNVLRSYFCTKGIFESDVSCSSLPEKARYAHVGVSGRLAISESVQREPLCRSENISQPPFSAGFYSEQSKIISHALSKFRIHRGSFQNEKGTSLPNSGKNFKAKKSSSRSSSGFGHSKSLLDFPGNDCIMLGLNSECKVIHETSPASFTSELESCQNAFKPKGCSDSIASSSCEVVVTGSEHSEGKICCSEALFDHCNHRCKWYMGLGWSHEFPYCARPVVSYTEIIAYQCFGNEGSNFDSPALSSCSQRPKCLDSVGQFYSLPIHQSPGGYSVTGSVPSGVGSLASSTGQQHFPQSSSYNGEDEYFSGHFEQADCAGHRMVIEQDNSVKNFQPVGLSPNRSICHQGQQTDTTFLFLASSLSSISIGCPVNCLAEHVCICISTDSVDSKNSESHETFSLQNHSYCTKLAKAALVPSAVRNAGSLSNQSSSSGRSSDSKQEEDCSSKSSKSELNCMASIDRKFSSEGFSNDARKLLSASWRSGTQRDYNGKFRRFSHWCSEQEIDPFTATLKDCAHFLTHLFNSGLKYKTITGYRSMLSSVLAPIGRTPVGQHPVIIRLFRGVFNKRPPLKELIPEWDLPLVLGCLQEPPFEPMKDASLKYVTWKTCFLIAITCFRRCSDLQALRLGEGNVNVQKKGITFMRAGLAKQDRPGHHSVRIFVPSLPKNKKLDPKRALSYYLKKTESFRRKGSDDIVQLFLAINKPHSPVSSQTISKWLVNVIKYAYGIHKKPIGNLKGHSTRSLGSSWALFKGASLEQVLDSADWSRETTFIKHYLKPVGIDFLNS